MRRLAPPRAILMGAVTLLLLLAPGGLHAQGRAFQPNDWHKVTTLSSPAMSPDGSKVAFVVTTVVEADNKRHSEVWVVHTAGGEPVRYTAPGYESTSPRWSDDGTRLIFNSTRPGGRSPWALRMDQPGGDEAAGAAAGWLASILRADRGRQYRSIE